MTRAMSSRPSKAKHHMFSVFAKKGADSNPSCQRVADKYYFYLKDYFTEVEARDLTLTRKSALAGNSRNGFDTICSQIEKRIWE